MMEESKEVTDIIEVPEKTVGLPVKRRTIISQVKDKLDDQDFKQKASISSVIILEMYRVIISSFLVLFVPQRCGDHVCSLRENMVLENHLYSAGLVFNFITMASFFLMYTLEIKRENRLITYLEVNKFVAADNNSVGLALDKLNVNKRHSIWLLDKYYMYSGRVSIVMFIINTILSGFVVYNYYLDNQTTTTYITNILFMVTKLADVYSNVNTDKNIFYSAYMKEKIQYNDVDPDKQLLLIENKNEPIVPGISPPLDAVKKEEENKIEEHGKIEEEDSKIIVTIHDINSPTSSSDNLQKMDP
jgi:hypothetical protein